MCDHLTQVIRDLGGSRAGPPPARPSPATSKAGSAAGRGRVHKVPLNTAQCFHLTKQSNEAPPNKTLTTHSEPVTEVFGCNSRLTLTNFGVTSQTVLKKYAKQEMESKRDTSNFVRVTIK